MGNVFLKKKTCLWKKFLTYLLWGTVGVFVLGVFLGILEVILGGKIGKYFLAILIGEAITMALAFISSAWVGRIVTLAYLNAYGDQAHFWINYNWINRSGCVGLLGIIAAVAWSLINAYVAGKLFPS